MNIKLDENLSRSHVKLLQAAGHDADRVTDEGLSGAKDPEVWAEVIRIGRFFITLDLDFSDVRHFQPGTHPGILLIRPEDNSLEASMAILQRVMEETPLEQLAGCLTVANPRRTRIRRPSAQES